MALVFLNDRFDSYKKKSEKKKKQEEKGREKEEKGERTASLSKIKNNSWDEA